MMGLPIYASILGWIDVLIELACIELIMTGFTKRLESVQSQRYGNLRAYQEYLRTVPVLFLLIRL